jgi:hypothetical protein
MEKRGAWWSKGGKTEFQLITLRPLDCIQLLICADTSDKTGLIITPFLNLDLIQVKA